ncbi:MAG: transglycosylase SLT domain-containing protein [Deltaproteobacteria bacterium]|nr:transglycosylase SLT domain-containing protein [Deltaproteobacteria bacterium]
MSQRSVLSLVALSSFLAFHPRALADSTDDAAAAFAARDYAKVLKLLPRRLADDGAEANVLRARALLHLGRPAEALDSLEGVAKQLPHLADLVAFLHGEALLGTKAYLKAAESFHSAASLKGSRWVDLARERRAEALLHAGRPQASAAAYLELLKSYPTHPRRPALLVALAQARLAAGQRVEAAEGLQAVWLEHPSSAAAARAAEILQELRDKGVRPKPAELGELVGRIRKLRKTKRYEQVVAELRELRQRMPAAAVALDLQLVLTHRKAEQYAEGIALLESLTAAVTRRGAKGKPSLAYLRNLRIDLLCRAGRIDEGIALAKGALPENPKRRDVPRLTTFATLLGEHGRYAEGLGVLDQAAALLKNKKAFPAQRAWFAYRAGQHDRAIAGLQQLVKGKKRLAFSLYWQARAHARAGRTAQAEALYRQLLESHLREYYGIQARSRLVEAKKLRLEEQRCAETTATPTSDAEAQLEKLAEQYGALLPGLPRARSLWQMGMLEDARRELMLTALDFSWTVYRGRFRQYRMRPEVVRLWRGGPAPKPERTPKRDKLVRQQKAELRLALGAVTHAAGLSYFGWRFSPADPDPVRRSYPRAYPHLVAETSRRFDVDPNLIWAVMRTESVYKPDVISRVGAAGLMQFMAHTAERVAGELGLANYQPADVFNPATNLTMAGHYLRAVTAKFRGQVPLVAAAYNGGPHNVARWLKARGSTADMDEFIEEIPLDESKRYAKKIVRLMALYERAYCGKDDRTVSNTLDPSFSAYPGY